MKPAMPRRTKRQTSKRPNRVKTTQGNNERTVQAEAKVTDGERIQHVPIAKINIGNRYRKDYGDLEELAQSIQEIGLLQPIGVTEDFKLVFGGRRLDACRDILDWKEIDVRIVKVSSIIRGEHDENELRKDFTPSERVAIAKALTAEIGERRGNPSIRRTCAELDVRTDQLVAKKSGFSNRDSFRRAKKVVEKGSPKLVEAMDDGKITVSAAAELADMPMRKQVELLSKDVKEIRRTADMLRQPKRHDKPTAEFHSNGRHLAATSSGPKRNADSTPPTEDWTRETILDLKNHWDTMKLILTPVCDEAHDIKLKPIEKRTIIRIVREAIELHRDLDQGDQQVNSPIAK